MRLLELLELIINTFGGVVLQLSLLGWSCVLSFSRLLLRHMLHTTQPAHDSNLYQASSRLNPKKALKQL